MIFSPSEGPYRFIETGRRMFSNQLILVIDSPGSIEKLPYFHLFPGIGSSVRARRDIQDEPS
jgi:hypothetical protein